MLDPGDTEELYRLVSLERDAIRRKHAQEALGKLLLGQLPPKKRLDSLARILTDDGVDALIKARNRTADDVAWNAFMDVIGVNRAIMASTDISMLLRQGLPLTARKFYWEQLGPMFKAMSSDAVADSYDALLREPPVWMDAAARRQRATIELLDNPGVSRGARNRAEEFSSNLADNFPWPKSRLRFIRGSNRAYVFTGNWLRMRYYDEVADILRKLPTTTEQDYKNLARWVNIVTGRGELPKGIGKSSFGVFLNQTLFLSLIHI